MEDKRALVTGGSGFIGSHLVDRLIEYGYNVTVIDDLSYGKIENLNEKATFFKLDIRDYHKLLEVIDDQDIIFHLAANATTRESSLGWIDPVNDYQVNAVGTLNVFRSVVEADCNAKVVYASSAAVYGEPKYLPITENHPINPISPYGVSKVAGEKYATAYSHEYGIETVTLRIFNTYGPRQPRYVMFDFLKKLKENPKLLKILGTGEQIRDYCYIDDTIDAFILADKKIKKGVFNVAGGNPVSIRDLAKVMLEILGLNNTKLEFTQKSWRGDITTLVADISRLKKFGFKPETDLEGGILKLVEYFKETMGPI
ncbi:SDR family NAD(P)-dependent oxidoreductase [Candidatus Pacearchaeota archaeon]|nr:SDR family NAD(P)-dependent oxidoreductase [Candidatus Pacearchaeota archaeon]